LCPRISRDIVHHHVLPRESIFYLGGGGRKFLEMKSRDEGSKDRFPQGAGIG